MIMRLESAIQQKSFDSPYQKALLNLIYTASWATNHIQKMLAEYDLTMQQFNVLRILRGSYPTPLSTNTIRERMVQQMSDAPKIVDRLLKKNLVSKKVNDNDRRLVDVCISEQGRALLADIDPRKQEMESVLRNLDADDVNTLNLLLEKARVNAFRVQKTEKNQNN